MRIHTSDNTRNLLNNNQDFLLEERGELQIKVKKKKYLIFLLECIIVQNVNYMQAHIGFLLSCLIHVLIS